MKNLLRERLLGEIESLKHLADYSQVKLRKGEYTNEYGNIEVRAIEKDLREMVEFVIKGVRSQSGPTHFLTKGAENEGN